MPLCFASTLSALLFALPISNAADIKVSDPNIVYSPYNWFVSGSDYAQTPNPGAYLKMGFTGSRLSLNLDVSPLTGAKVPAEQYPVIRYSIDGGPATIQQLTPATTIVPCAKGLKEGNHSLLLQYVAGYVFLDFWTPVNVIKVTGLTLDDGAKTIPAFGADEPKKRLALFLGDSITNGDDNIATFKGGITNAVDTQDATIGYPSVVAVATKAEYGVVAYGGASWESTAADGHTPGLMTFWSMFDKEHSRLFKDPSIKLPKELYKGRLDPVPDDIYVNMGENRAPNYREVAEVLNSIQNATGSTTNIFVIVPFSGRARMELQYGVSLASEVARYPNKTYLLDLGSNPYLPDNRPTMFSVDGQHPLAALHAQLGAQIVAERARLLAGK